MEKKLKKVLTKVTQTLRQICETMFRFCLGLMFGIMFCSYTTMVHHNHFGDCINSISKQLLKDLQNEY